MIDSCDTSKLEFKATPLPKKFFSVIEPPKDAPSVPTPAPRVNSPVGFSSIEILIIRVLGEFPSITSVSTFLNIPSDLI